MLDIIPGTIPSQNEITSQHVTVFYNRAAKANPRETPQNAMNKLSWRDLGDVCDAPPPLSTALLVLNFFEK